MEGWKCITATRKQYLCVLVSIETGAQTCVCLCVCVCEWCARMCVCVLISSSLLLSVSALSSTSGGMRLKWIPAGFLFSGFVTAVVYCCTPAQRQQQQKNNVDLSFVLRNTKDKSTFFFVVVFLDTKAENPSTDLWFMLSLYHSFLLCFSF